MLALLGGCGDATDPARIGDGTEVVASAAGGPGYGYALTAVDDALAIGVRPPTSGFGDRRSASPSVELAALPALTLTTRWLGVSALAFDAADIDGDGRSELAVGRFVVATGRAGDLDLAESALLTVPTPSADQVGGVAFADGGAELWVAALRYDDTLVTAWSTALRGAAAESDARAALAFDYANDLAAWDGDGDGLDDLLVAEMAGLAWFQGPWEDGAAPDGAFAFDCAGCDLSSGLFTVGDVAGTGAEVAAFATWHAGDEPSWAEGVYLVESADQVGLLEDLPREIVGVVEYESLGTDVTSADLDGDGQQDLVIGGMGGEDQPGEAVVFLGPVPAGDLSTEDADLVLTGAPGELVGYALARVDADGDGIDDLALGAPNRLGDGVGPAGDGLGAVLVVSGADLF